MQRRCSNNCPRNIFLLYSNPLKFNKAIVELNCHVLTDRSVYAPACHVGVAVFSPLATETRLLSAVPLSSQIKSMTR